MLVEGLPYLQQRIPDLIQLLLAEKQSMARVAYLDQEFVDRGVYAAGAWHITKTVTGRTGEELREERHDIRREVERELLALAKGISHANLQRKHRLGDSILQIYFFPGLHLNRTQTDPAHKATEPETPKE